MFLSEALKDADFHLFRVSPSLFPVSRCCPTKFTTPGPAPFPALSFCRSVGGVQSQSITVDRQMRRYDVPRVAFINKLDRAGADPWKVLKQMREKLRLNVAAVQVGAVALERW